MAFTVRNFSSHFTLVLQLETISYALNLNLKSDRLIEIHSQPVKNTFIHHDLREPKLKRKTKSEPSLIKFYNDDDQTLNNGYVTEDEDYIYVSGKPYDTTDFDDRSELESDATVSTTARTQSPDSIDSCRSTAATKFDNQHDHTHRNTLNFDRTGLNNTDYLYQIHTNSDNGNIYYNNQRTWNFDYKGMRPQDCNCNLTNSRCLNIYDPKNSRLHKGVCKYYKSRRCRNGDDCEYCHTCDPTSVNNVIRRQRRYNMREEKRQEKIKRYSLKYLKEEFEKGRVELVKN